MQPAEDRLTKMVFEPSCRYRLRSGAVVVGYPTENAQTGRFGTVGSCYPLTFQGPLADSDPRKHAHGSRAMARVVMPVCPSMTGAVQPGDQHASAALTDLLALRIMRTFDGGDFDTLASMIGKRPLTLASMPTTGDNAASRGPRS